MRIYTFVLAAMLVFGISAHAMREDFLIEGDVLYKYNGTSREVKIPQGVREIAAGAFRGTDIESVTLPAQLERISEYAFSGCSKLESVYGGADIIDDCAFKDCTALKTFQKSYLAQEIGNAAFENCVSLENFSFSDGLWTMGNNAFKNSAIKNVKIPKTLENVPNGAFWGCGGLADLKLEEGVVQIGEYAFSGTSIVSVSLPETLEAIGYGAFCECKELMRVYCEYGLITISKKAFMNDKKLHKFQFPDSLEEIGEYAFYGCDSFENHKIPKTAKVFDTSFPGEKEELPSWFKGNIRLSNGKVIVK